MSEWKAESKSFTAEMSAADQLAVRLFRYPAWRVEVNGREVETAARAGSRERGRTQHGSETDGGTAVGCLGLESGEHLCLVGEAAKG